MSSLILTDVADGILRIQINRPDKKNALTVAMYAENLRVAMNEHHADRRFACRAIECSRHLGSGKWLAQQRQLGGALVADGCGDEERGARLRYRALTRPRRWASSSATA